MAEVELQEVDAPQHRMTVTSVADCNKEKEGTSDDKEERRQEGEEKTCAGGRSYRAWRWAGGLVRWLNRGSRLFLLM